MLVKAIILLSIIYLYRTQPAIVAHGVSELRQLNFNTIWLCKFYFPFHFDMAR